MTDSLTTTVSTDNKNSEEKLSIKDFGEQTKHVVKSPLFLMFAEYLGFVSKVIDWAEDWCLGNKPSDYKINIIETDAIRLFNQAKNKYSKEELVSWYDEFYTVILADYDKNLEKISAN